MHSSSFYVYLALGISFGPLLPVVVPFCVMLWKYDRMKTEIRSLLEFIFPLILYTKAVVVSDVQLPNEARRERSRAEKLLCFEGRRISNRTLEAQVCKIMLIVTMVLVVLVTNIFLSTLLLEESYECQSEKPGGILDCFPTGVDIITDVPPLNCSSLNTTTNIVCYKLSFNFNLAASVSYGLFRLSTAIFHIIALVCLKFVGSHCCGSMQTSLILIRFFAVVVFLAAFAFVWCLKLVSPGFEIAVYKSLSLEAVLQIIQSSFLTCAFVVGMPWDRIANSHNVEELWVDQESQPSQMSMIATSSAVSKHTL